MLRRAARVCVWNPGRPYLQHESERHSRHKWGQFYYCVEAVSTLCSACAGVRPGRSRVKQQLTTNPTHGGYNDSCRTPLHKNWR